MKFKNIDFIKDSFTEDNIVLTDTNGQPYDVLSNSDMQSMTVLGDYIFYFITNFFKIYFVCIIKLYCFKIIMPQILG